LITRTKLPTLWVVSLLLFGFVIAIGLLDAYVLHPDRQTLARPPFLFVVALIAAGAFFLLVRVWPPTKWKRVGWGHVIAIATMLFVSRLIGVDLANFWRDQLLNGIASILVSLLVVGIWKLFQVVGGDTAQGGAA
jgi:uncharacterized BrkB/YihY/UPF0761 family membrane protein